MRRIPVPRIGICDRFIKRVMDLAVSLTVLLLSLPLLLLIGLVVRLDSAGPVFYLHRRVGRSGKPFRLYKFRTMDVKARTLTRREHAEFSRVYKLQDDPRVTRAGYFLRHTGLDELPQLLNVLKGEMSLVGPRPVVTEELERYGDRAAELLSVRPGLTGYWQIFSRPGERYSLRVRRELFYVRHRSPLFDLQIFGRTFGWFLRRIFSAVSLSRGEADGWAVPLAKNGEAG